jgi:hypothetical protein
MPKSRFYNTELRGFILQHAIRQEFLTSEILKFIFRILKNKTKTLDNNSSSLTFRNKIDLLHDLGDITDGDYKDFTKILEIRNQFAHNAKCISFIQLQNEKPEITLYLGKNFANNESNIETRLLKSYISLFKKCHRILCEIKKSYHYGFLIELEKFQSYELLHNRFDDWVKQSMKNFEETWNKHDLDNLLLQSMKIFFFTQTMDAFRYKIFSEIAFDTSTGKNFQELFKRKMSRSEWGILNEKNKALKNEEVSISESKLS